MTETETKWSELVREWKSSGRTAKEFVEGRDFKPSTLVYWASCLRTGIRRCPRGKKREAGVRMSVVPSSVRTDDLIVVAIGGARVFDAIVIGTREGGVNLGAGRPADEARSLG